MHKEVYWRHLLPLGDSGDGQVIRKGYGADNGNYVRKEKSYIWPRPCVGVKLIPSQNKPLLDRINGVSQEAKFCIKPIIPYEYANLNVDYSPLSSSPYVLNDSSGRTTTISWLTTWSKFRGLTGLLVQIGMLEFILRGKIMRFLKASGLSLGLCTPIMVPNFLNRIWLYGK